MTPFEELIDESNRFLVEEAGGDPAHPGAKLRILILLSLSEGETREHLVSDILAAGFLPWPDRYDPEAEISLCSEQAVARAIGVPVAEMGAEVEKFIASDIGSRLGFSREMLFPERCSECPALH